MKRTLAESVQKCLQLINNVGDILNRFLGKYAELTILQE